MFTFVLILLFTTGISNALGEQFIARVSVASPADVINLHLAGATIDDAKVRTRFAPDGRVQYNASYNVENGFVTVIGDQKQFDDLERRGFSISILGEVKESP